MELLTYLHLQMRLEGKGISQGCSMRQVEVVPDEEMPLILIARLANEELIVYYDEAIPPNLQKQLSAMHIDFPEVIPFLEILKSLNRQCEVGHYKTYVFPPQPILETDVLCLSKNDSRVQALGFDGFAKEVYALAYDDRLVSACVSTRENERCGEAWVYTVPEYRKRGFAQKVVQAWARSLMEAGKVPFYSHNLKNEASANLAKKLGLLPVFEEISITQI
jgi:GNAT superfamily N-acetyltransferase